MTETSLCSENYIYESCKSGKQTSELCSQELTERLESDHFTTRAA